MEKLLHLLGEKRKMNWIDKDTTYILLKKMCNICVLRHRVIANNIANVDTPGFQARRVVFEEKLKNALRVANTKENLQNITPEIRIDDVTRSLREDLNNVDIEKEMVRLSVNSLRYSIYIQLLDKKLEKIKLAIKGR